MRFLLKYFVLMACVQCMTLNVNAQNNINNNEKLYRPAIHFTPLKGWMNDPNGMFYKDGLYHLYYQYFPDATVWGPMHWGHATSSDLIHWEHQPIALYPDSIGLIFSGSAVVDEKNSSGFGKNGKAPIVAIFTQHNMAKEKAGKVDAQNQSIAYSNDNGTTWTMYANNPIIHNPGIADFRDPKVIWHEASKKWIMTLAVKNKVSFFSSSNLKNWNKESDFGMDIGSHEGVWECPDLFSLDFNNTSLWVLTTSINPGGPNKGSATQYFIGQFDGHTFKANSTKTKWMDYGADNYAGVTWSNTGKEKISMGWMSNWLYAQQVPTEQWRSAMTLPRSLSIKEIKGEQYLISTPYYAVTPKVASSNQMMTDKIIDKTMEVPYVINFNQEGLSSFTISMSNQLGEHVNFGYDSTTKQYFIDRSAAGIHDFNAAFAAKHVAPKLTNNKNNGLYAIIDKTSIELFAENGFTVMTDLFFPTTPYTKISIQSESKNNVRKYFSITPYLIP